jgi:hypothetical protein
MPINVDYYKEVLGKISFADRATFLKELKKAFRRLDQEGRDELKRWFRNVCVCRVEAPVMEPVRRDRFS